MDAIATPTEFSVPVERDTSLVRVVVALCGLACLPIGIIWDVSHHSTIGRDTFWTPAHILIQLGGIVPALLFTALAFKMTFFPSAGDRNASVSIWGMRAPIGVWVTIWGCLAMVSSAPFDDWWHNTYGLDVKIISPPHTVLGIGMLAVGMGVLLFVFSAQNQAAVSLQKHRGIFCAVAVGIMLALEADFTTEFCWPNLQHSDHFYRVLCMPFPLLLVLAARAARIRGAATIAAASYMTVYILLILILPLFPAHPKLGPIFHPVDHMVPPMFPLLLILPAIAIDFIEWKFGGPMRVSNISPSAVRKIICAAGDVRKYQMHVNEARPLTELRVRIEPYPKCADVPALVAALEKEFETKFAMRVPVEAVPPGTLPWVNWNDWLLAVVLAVTFLLIAFPVQWNFSRFLLSDFADNRFFARAGHWPYFSQPGDWMNTFWTKYNDPVTGISIPRALIYGCISTRLGLWLGNYLLRLKR